MQIIVFLLILEVKILNMKSPKNTTFIVLIVRIIKVIIFIR